MSEYRIEFAPSAFRALGKLDPQIRKRLVPQIEALADEPRPVGARDVTARDIRLGDDLA